MILIIEDESLIAMHLRMQIEDLGIEVCGTAATADAGIALAQRHRPAVVLIDFPLRGGTDGVDAAFAIQASVGSEVIFITELNDQSAMERIRRCQPSAILAKPVDNQELGLAVLAAFYSQLGRLA